MSEQGLSHPIPDLHKWRRGDAILARRLQQTNDAVNILAKGSRIGPRQIIPTPRGTAEAKEPSPGVQIAAFRFETYGANHVGCTRYDEPTGDPTVNVARPPELRVYPWDNGSPRFNFSRAWPNLILSRLNNWQPWVSLCYYYPTAANSPWWRQVMRSDKIDENRYPTETYYEAISPPYHDFNDQTHAELGRFILAAKVGSDVTGVSAVEWLDLNITARRWVMVPPELLP